MDCRDVARDIDAYWDRELPADRSARIRAHLGQCPACHAEFGRLDDWLSARESVVVPADLRDRVVAAVLEAVDQGRGTGVLPVEHGQGGGFHRNAAKTGTPLTPRRTEAPVSHGKYHRLIPLVWAGALAACITLLFVSRPDVIRTSPSITTPPDPVMIPSFVMAALQPSPIAAAGAAMAQAAALERVTQTRPELPLRTGRRPLRADFVPADSSRNVQQLPAVISAVSPLGA